MKVVLTAIVIACIGVSGCMHPDVDRPCLQRLQGETVQHIMREFGLALSEASLTQPLSGENCVMTFPREGQSTLVLVLDCPITEVISSQTGQIDVQLLQKRVLEIKTEK